MARPRPGMPASAMTMARPGNGSSRYMWQMAGADLSWPAGLTDCIASIDANRMERCMPRHARQGPEIDVDLPGGSWQVGPVGFRMIDRPEGRPCPLHGEWTAAFCCRAMIAEVARWTDTAPCSRTSSAGDSTWPGVRHAPISDSRRAGHPVADALADTLMARAGRAGSADGTDGRDPSCRQPEKLDDIDDRHQSHRLKQACLYSPQAGRVATPQRLSCRPRCRAASCARCLLLLRTHVSATPTADR